MNGFRSLIDFQTHGRLGLWYDNYDHVHTVVCITSVKIPQSLHIPLTTSTYITNLDRIVRHLNHYHIMSKDF